MIFPYFDDVFFWCVLWIFLDKNFNIRAQWSWNFGQCAQKKAVATHQLDWIMNFKWAAMSIKKQYEAKMEMKPMEREREKSIWKRKANEKKKPWPLDNNYWFRLLVMHRSYDNRIFLCKITHGHMTTARAHPFENIDKMQRSTVVTVRQRQKAVAMTRFSFVVVVFFPKI